MHMIFEQYDERLNRLKRHRRTVYNFRAAARSFQEFLDEQGVSAENVEEWLVEEFFAGSQYATTTKRTMLKSLRAAYSYAHQRGVIDRQPTKYVQLELVPEKEPRILSSDELREIKERCYDRRQWMIFHLYAYSGIRKMEGAGLVWDDVDESSNTISVHGKQGKFRLVPVHPALGEIFAATERATPYLITGGRKGGLSDAALHEALQKFAPGVGFHDFRRTVASSLYRNGVQPDTIDRIMGWAPSTVRSRYYQNIADDLLQQAILQLYRDDPL
jgi:integrase